MQKETTESTRGVRSVPLPEQNVERLRTAPAPDARQVGRRKESRRPWSVRRSDSPSWVEKIDQF